MITAVIQHKKDTLVVELPRANTDLQIKLLSIGVRTLPQNIKLFGGEDAEIDVQLASGSRVGQHLCRLFSTENSLGDVNTTAYLVQTADEGIKTDLEHDIYYDQYGTAQELIDDIKERTLALGPVKMSLYFPLQRMLTDPTYLGTETHPPIIDRETFDKVQEIMQSRNTQKGHQREKVFSSSVVPIICGKCGATTNRRYDARWVNSTAHICTNSECKASYAISDEILWELVRIKIAAADETEVDPSEDIMKAICRLTNEIDRDLQGLDIDAETLKNKIFECAALQYAALHIKQRESVDFTKMKPHSPVLIREIKKRVVAITFNASH